MEPRIKLGQMWWTVEPAMMLLTWSCSSKWSGQLRATSKWPVEVLLTGNGSPYWRLGNICSSVAVW